MSNTLMRNAIMVEDGTFFYTELNGLDMTPKKSPIYL